MNSKQTQWSMIMVIALAGTVGVVAFLMFMVVGGWSFSPAFFIALLLAAVVFVVLLIGFHEKAAPPKALDSDTTGAPAAKPSAPSQAAAPAAAPSKPAASQTKAAPKAEDAAPEAGDKPAVLSQARAGGADDLKKIKGVGPKLEKMLNEMGIYHFDQVASWTEKEVAWVDENLVGFKGRVSRDDWVAQAKELAKG